MVSKPKASLSYEAELLTRSFKQTETQLEGQFVSFCPYYCTELDKKTQRISIQTNNIRIIVL